MCRTSFHVCYYGSPHQGGPYQSLTGAHTPSPPQRAGNFFFRGTGLPTAVRKNQRVQPMRQAKLLRINIVDSDIEHQLLCRATSSSSSSSSNNSSNNSSFSSSSDSGKSSSPARGGSDDDDDEYMSSESTISTGSSDSSSHGSPEPHFPAIFLPSMLCVPALLEGSLDDRNLGRLEGVV